MSVSHVDIDPDGDLIIALPPQDLRYKPFSDVDKKGDSIMETRLKVSVKHLTLASRRAKVMFASNFIEAQPDAEGYRHWKFEPIFDPSAFEIVMYAVHGKTQKLPDTVTLETLTQIAVIVDDLETYQALCFAAKRWIKRLGDQGGKGPFQIDLTRYILVSFVFDEPEMFGAMTKRAIFHNNQPLHSFELPIRPKILDAINARREAIIKTAISKIHYLIREIIHRARLIDCSDHMCESIVLGTIIKETGNIMIPRIAPPYSGLCIATLHQLSTGFKLPDMFQETKSDKQNLLLPRYSSVVRNPKSAWRILEGMDSLALPNGNGRRSGSPISLTDHDCRLRKFVMSEIGGLNTGVEGLKLLDFKSTVGGT
ncbi:hypothetical protein NM208_g2393 [Fusarium decemcellulare]|uniref:Uncharacterized protein n=1 Tax=Fusarium decemcellulare TaxID=57161 RepID=A0ACC1SSR6_9HYPO|nr:hypothetical protein NM208_g2393 [Fusarium decemcellulare]